METENLLTSIEQWYRRAIALNRNWRESRREEETRRRSSKAGAETEHATILSIAEETTVSSVGDNQACSDRRSRKNEYSGVKRIGTECRGFSEMGLLYNRGRSEKKLLCLWRLWAHGPPL